MSTGAVSSPARTGAPAVDRAVRLEQQVAVQAARTPGAAAICFGPEQVSYGELDRRANHVAHRLRALGVRDRDVVGMLCDRSPAMVAAMLGVLRTGAAFMPLDGSAPPARLRGMLDDGGARCVVVDAAGEEPAGWDGAVLVLDAATRTGEAAAPPPVTDVTVDDLAYVIWTSGSTGRPKGVEIRHRSLMTLLAAWQLSPGLGAGDVVLTVSRPSFDPSMIEIWLPLLVGASMRMLTTEASRDPRVLRRELERPGLTHVGATPSIWQSVLEVGWEGTPGLVCSSGAEALPPPLAERLLTRCAQLWNCYGPTETTVTSTLERVLDRDVTIGRPIEGTVVHVVDEQLRPVTPGTAGELLIGGAGVGAGYRGRPDLTAERFLPDTLSAPADRVGDGSPGAGRLYRTGDLVRQRSDGRLDHLGRIDHQLKLRGYRIEPGEIEAVLMAHPAVDAAVVVAAETPLGARLVGHLLGSPPDVAVVEAELEAQLRETLPGYMVPSALVWLAAYPLTPNGKIDRGALPAPPEPGQAAGTAPRTDLERRLAEVWREVLGRPLLDVDADFFALGGDSLTAVRLLVEVETRLGVRLPLSTTVERSMTVAAMARQLSGAGPAPDKSAGRTLFMIVPDDANVVGLRHLVGPLAPGVRVHPLLPERVGGRFERGGSVVALAERLLEQVVAEQPTGPYLLAGYSFGGVLAYEVAVQLERRGARVSWLGLLDTVNLAGLPVSARVLAAPRGVLQDGWGEAWRRAQGWPRLLVQRTRGSRAADDAAPAFDEAGAGLLSRRYRTTGTSTPVDLFVTHETVAILGDRRLWWGRAHPSVVRVHEVGGRHADLLRLPWATVLGHELSRSAASHQA